MIGPHICTIFFIAEKVVPSFYIARNATVCNMFIEWDGTTFYVPVLSKVGTSSIGTYPMVVWGYAVYKPIVCCVTPIVVWGIRVYKPIVCCVNGRSL